MKVLPRLTATLLWVFAAAPALATATDDDALPSGGPVGVFENPGLNYRLDLTDAGYRYINASLLFPDASFAALRLDPHVVSVVIAEELAVPVTAEKYAEMVLRAMQARLDENGNAGFNGSRRLGDRDTPGAHAVQNVIRAELGGEPVTYVVSAIADGPHAYQLLSFSTTADEAALIEEADRLLAGFAIPQPSPPLAGSSPARDVADYRSATFGYRVRARGSDWMDWQGVQDDLEAADFGALSFDGYGLVVMPACWQGEAPAATTLYRLALQQFGEDYPSDFVTAERDVHRGAASGRLFVGRETIDGDEFLYHIAMLSTPQCAYLFSAWGLSSAKNVESKLEKLWDDFEISDSAAAGSGVFGTPGERHRNALVLNGIGLQQHGLRSYRDAFRFFDQANALEPEDPAIVANAVQTLAALSAYPEAADWLAGRIGPVAGDAIVRSWDAWLAYRLGDNTKSARIYSELFAAGYRDDDDFAAYAHALADDGDWDAVDRAFADYSAGGAAFAVRVLEAELLGQRGRHDEALALLDKLGAGRAFNPELAYARIALLEDAGNPAEVLRLADELIANNYRSLQSYFYKGSAQYALQSYREAQASFEQALTYAPANTTVREYLDAIDAMLGEGDVSLISQSIEPVTLPGKLAKLFARDDDAADHKGYGSEYLSRIKGLETRGDNVVVTTWYQKIRVFDDNGVEAFSTLQFDFDAAAEQLFVNALRVRNPDGEVIAEGNLQSYFVTSDDEGYEASTERTAHLPVPNLAPGMSIEAIVSKRTRVEAGTFPLETHFLATDRPIRNSAIFVRGDAGKLSWVSNAVPTPGKQDGVLVWQVRDPVAYRWEPLMPQHDQILPWVKLGSAGRSWEDVGRDYLAKISDKLGADGIADRAARLVEGVASRDRQIEILSAYVQDEITYKAIEFGRRAYIPKTGRETLRDRYGDCKDHAVLLAAMLNAVGIDATLALVNLYEAVNPELPNTDQFNHVIVAIPEATGSRFVDATDKDLRLGSLVPRSLSGNYALLLDAAAPSLVQIPDYDAAGDTGLEVERIVELADEATLEVRETARLSGYQAANLRSQLRTIEAPDMQSSIQRWVASRYADAEVTGYAVDNVFDANYDLVVEIRYRLPIREDGKFELPGFVESYYLEYDRVADRRFPFELFYPLRVSARTTVRIPPGHELAAGLKRPDAAESPFGAWRRDVHVAADGWDIRFDYEASDERFPAGEYRAFADFQRDAIRGIEAPVVLR